VGALALLVALAPLVSGEALAQGKGDKNDKSDLPARVREMQPTYDQATRLMEKKSFAEACPLLEKVVARIPEGLGGKITLAECYEGAGKPLRALRLYEQVVLEADAQKQGERKKKAATKVEALLGVVPTLTLEVAPASAEVKLDGEKLGLEALSSKVSVEPGEHRLEASAPSHEPWSKALSLGEGAREVVRIRLTPKVAAVAPEVRERPLDRRALQGIAALAAGGLGVVSLAVGAGMGGVALDKAGARGRECPGSVCTPAGLTLDSEAKTAADLSTGFFVGGALGVAAGVTLFLLRPSAPSKATVEPTASGLRVRF
jgi:hypothetical protein